jgi:hypothetical protein
MHPTFKQVPPKLDCPLLFIDSSMHKVFKPNCADLIADTYPAGPLPITITSNIFSLIL